MKQVGNLSCLCLECYAIINPCENDPPPIQFQDKQQNQICPNLFQISEELYEELLLHRKSGTGNGQSILKKQAVKDDSCKKPAAKDDSTSSKNEAKEIQMKKSGGATPTTPGTIRVVTLTPVSPPSFVLSPARKSESGEPESPRTVSPNGSVLAPLSTDLQVT